MCISHTRCISQILIWFLGPTFGCGGGNWAKLCLSQSLTGFCIYLSSIRRSMQPSFLFSLQPQCPMPQWHSCRFKFLQHDKWHWFLKLSKLTAPFTLYWFILIQLLLTSLLDTWLFLSIKYLRYSMPCYQISFHSVGSLLPHQYDRIGWWSASLKFPCGLWWSWLSLSASYLYFDDAINWATQQPTELRVR